MYKLISLLFWSFSLTLSAQKTTGVDSLRLKYNNQTIYRYGSTFLKGVERLSFQELSKEFSMSELGLAGYEKAKKYRTTSKVLRYISLGLSVAFISAAASGNRNLAYGFLGGQFVSGAMGMRYNSLSHRSLDRALWQRNKDLLFPPR